MAVPKLVVTPPADEPPQENVADLWESAQAVKIQPLTWLVPHRILQGALSILEGEKGVSKSMWCCALVASLTAGKKFLDRKKSKPVNVLWLPGEEDAAKVVKPRLIAAGANLEYVQFPGCNERGERRRVVFPDSTQYVREAVDHFKAGLLIVDPLSCHVAPEVSLTNDQAIHQVLDPLADISHATGCTILLTRNLTKATGDSRLNRGLGGAAVGGVARSILVIDWPDRKSSRRVLRLVAGNQIKECPPVEYELHDKDGWPVMAKVREVPADQDDDGQAVIDPGERDVREDARTLLRRLIGNQWVAVSVVDNESLAAAIGQRTLRAAKADLGVRSRRVGNTTPARWEWGPPAGGWK